VSPRVRKDSMHPRLQLGASGRPLNFTVRARIQDSIWKVIRKWEPEPKTLRLTHTCAPRATDTSLEVWRAEPSFIASLLPRAHSSFDEREL